MNTPTTAAENLPSKILIVDDEGPIGRILERELSVEGYRCHSVQSGEDALLELKSDDYSLVISDINMPGMSGVELLKHLIGSEQEIAVIMLTGLPDLSTAVQCLKMGAYDYLTKPIDSAELSISVSRALERRQFLIREKRYQQDLEREVTKKTQALADTQKEIIYRLALAAEYRDEDTWEHLLRIADSSCILARQMGLSDEFCEMIRATSPLHDIGKVGIPDSILLKPARLTPEEYESMKTHTTIGARILRNSDSKLIRMACEIAGGHHEHYDGKGYPQGKKRREIPIAARIVAVADVFDALTSKRPYKEAWSVDKATQTILEERETHFDPDVVDAFGSVVHEIVSARERYRRLFEKSKESPDEQKDQFVYGYWGVKDTALISGKGKS